MLTIGELAAYAGVTVRAVRHYHAKGLLPEPERDHSGYRRYDARAVADLIKIRTLAEAGVPLARVRELLAADDADFAAATREIDRRLAAEITQLKAHRERIALLAAGDSLALPPEAAAYLARLRALGVSQRLVDGERDAWILVAAQMPGEMEAFMRVKDALLDKPDVVEWYRALDEWVDWEPGDPRLEALADRLVELHEAAEQTTAESAFDVEISDELAGLLDAVFVASVPSASHLMRLLEARGWRGWSKTQRIERPPEASDRAGARNR